MGGLTRPIKIVIVVTAIFMCLNAFLPLQTSPINQNEPTINQGPPTSEVTEYPFKLKVILPNNTYKLGEPVKITVALENIGNKSVEIWGLESRKDYFDFWIYDETNQSIYHYTAHDIGAHYQVIVEFTLAPNQSMTVTYAWNQTDDGGVQVPPEKYYIVAQTYMLVDEFQWGFEGALPLTSPPLEINIKGE